MGIAEKQCCERETSDAKDQEKKEQSP